MHRRGFTTTAAIAVAVILLGACGSSSEYRYVSNSKVNTYFKVPQSWAEFPQDKLVEALAQVGGDDLVNPLDTASLLAEKLEDDGMVEPRVLWRLSFDSDVDPALEHVILPGNAAPVVDVLVRDLTSPSELERRKAVDLAFVEKIFLVHVGLSGGLDAATLQAVLSGQSELPADFVITRDLQFDDGLRRLRLTASYRGPDEQVYTIDQTGVIDANTERLSILAIRAGENEYLANFDRLDEIAKSFTVKQKD